jgi:hypothetical protein
VTRTFQRPVDPTNVRVYRLYRFYDFEGRLLYIGQTGRRPLARLIEHLYEQQWAHEIARWEVDPRVWHSEVEVLAAEEAAIKVEKPIRNWVHNEGPHRQWQPKVMEYRHPGRSTPTPRRAEMSRIAKRRVAWTGGWLVAFLAVWLTLVLAAGPHWHLSWRVWPILAAGLCAEPLVFLAKLGGKRKTRDLRRWLAGLIGLATVVLMVMAR